MIDGPLAAPALSLAHTGDLLVAAVADAGSIGVDIERSRARRYGAIARFLDWPSSLWAQAGAPTADEFLHLWTLWEALFKAMPHAVLADARREFAAQIEQIRAGVVGPVVTAQWSGQSWHCPGLCWLSAVRWPSSSVTAMPEIPLFRVDRLAGDVESACIKKIPAPEGKFHF